MKKEINGKMLNEAIVRYLYFNYQDHNLEVISEYGEEIYMAMHEIAVFSESISTCWISESDSEFLARAYGIIADKYPFLSETSIERFTIRLGYLYK
jgi:hypothetical protein